LLHARTPTPESPLPVARPESLGLSSERLAYMGSYFQNQVERDAAAGYVIMVARDGKLAYATAVGLRDREQKSPMTLDTRFRIASMTKPVTAVAALMLYEEAKLQLDDPIERYLPEFGSPRVFSRLDAEGKPRTEPARRSITVRHLLTHTSGLGYGRLFDKGSPNAEAWSSLSLASDETLEQKVKEVAKLPLYNHPGEAWRYSVASDVLGRLVEVVAGMPFDRFLHQRILEPLQMTHTGFFVPPEAQALVAKVYRHDENGALVPGDFGPLGVRASAPAFISGGGGLVSTAGDYLRFAQMLANGGSLEGKQYLSPVTVELMTSNQVDEDAQSRYWGEDSRGLGYGLGVAPQIDFRQAPYANMDGDFAWGGILDTHWVASPRTGLVAVLMTQMNPVGSTMPRRTDGDFRGLLFASVRTLQGGRAAARR
jgi:CubicO group peptidase (beta-lactamase class C family)